MYILVQFLFIANKPIYPQHPTYLRLLGWRKIWPRMRLPTAMIPPVVWSDMKCLWSIMPAWLLRSSPPKNKGDILMLLGSLNYSSLISIWECSWWFFHSPPMTLNWNEIKPIGALQRTSLAAMANADQLQSTRCQSEGCSFDRCRFALASEAVGAGAGWPPCRTTSFLNQVIPTFNMFQLLTKHKSSDHICFLLILYAVFLET